LQERPYPRHFGHFVLTGRIAGIAISIEYLEKPGLGRCVHINGEPLEFLGFLIVFGLFILPVFVMVLFLQLTPGSRAPRHCPVQSRDLLFVFLFWGMALHRAGRYQLQSLVFAAILLRSMTLGWVNARHESRDGRHAVRQHALRFSGRAGPLYGGQCWMVTLFAFIVLDGLVGSAFYGMPATC
jgi:hypothetical protein